MPSIVEHKVCNSISVLASIQQSVCNSTYSTTYFRHSHPIQVHLYKCPYPSCITYITIPHTHHFYHHHSITTTTTATATTTTTTTTTTVYSAFPNKLLLLLLLLLLARSFFFRKQPYTHHAHIHLNGA